MKAKTWYLLIFLLQGSSEKSAPAAEDPEAKKVQHRYLKHVDKRVNSLHPNLITQLSTHTHQKMLLGLQYLLTFLYFQPTELIDDILKVSAAKKRC